MSEIKKDSIVNILLIQYKAVGDVLLLTPVVRAIKDKFPESIITFMVNKNESMIVKDYPLIDKFILVDKIPRNGLRNFWLYLKYNYALIKSIKGQYDVVIDFIGNPRSAIATLLSKAPLRIGRFGSRDFAYSHKVDTSRYLNTITLRLAHLKPLGIEVDYLRPQIVLNDEDRAFADNYIKSLKMDVNRPLVLLAPNSPHTSKRWLSDHFVELGKNLIHTYNAKILLLWGPGEHDHTKRILLNIGGNAIMIPETNLTEMAAIISHGDLMITNDGGTKHISYALGIRTIAIYGPTNPMVWNDQDFENNPALRSDVPCIQCEKRVCPRKYHICMIDVKPEQVFKTVELLLDK